MRKLLIAAVMGAALLAPSAPADSGPFMDAKGKFTFSEAVQIPGKTLEPGTYVVRRVDPLRAPGAVQFLSADETHVYATVNTVPIYRQTPTSAPRVMYGEDRKDAPLPIHALFYPGDPVGDELVYESRDYETVDIAFAPVPRSGLNAPSVCTNTEWLSFDVCRRALLDASPAIVDKRAPTGE